MIERISTPKVGDGLRASWGASVAGAINALAAGLETRAKPLENQRNRRGEGAPGVRTAGPFEPTFEENESGDKVLASVGPGFVPWGRRFIPVTPTIESNLRGGLIGLIITHPTSSSSVQAKIGQLSTNVYDLRTIYGGLNETFLPLYLIKDGAIEIDFRCYLAIAIRE